MDGENSGEPYEQMDDLGGFTPIFGLTPKWGRNSSTKKAETLCSGSFERWAPNST